jgi:hypothetical protein
MGRSEGKTPHRSVVVREEVVGGSRSGKGTIEQASPTSLLAVFASFSTLAGEVVERLCDGTSSPKKVVVATDTRGNRAASIRERSKK